MFFSFLAQSAFLFCLFSTTVCIPEFPVLLLYARIYGASKHECGAISLDGGRRIVEHEATVTIVTEKVRQLED